MRNAMRRMGTRIILPRSAMELWPTPATPWSNLAAAQSQRAARVSYNRPPGHVLRCGQECCVCTGGVSMPPFLRTLFETVIGLILIAVIWVIAAVVVNDPVRLPNLPAVLSKVIQLSENPDYQRHVVESVSALALGLPAALVVGVGVGLIAGLSPGLRWLLGPLVVVLAAAPMVVMMPVFIVWWGLLPATKAAAIFVVAAFPVMNMVMVATAAAHRPVHYGRRDHRQPAAWCDAWRHRTCAQRVPRVNPWGRLFHHEYRKYVRHHRYDG